MYDIIINIANNSIKLKDIDDLYKINPNSVKIEPHNDTIKQTLNQILKLNIALSKIVYSYNINGNINYIINEDYLNYITIYDIFKYFGVNSTQINVNINFNNSNHNMTTHYNILSNIIASNVMNLYNKRLYNINNVKKSKTKDINNLIYRQNIKKNNIKRELVKSIITMLQLDYIKTKIYPDFKLDQLDHINIPNINIKDKTNNINIYNNLLSDSVLFEKYEIDLFKKGIILYKHKSEIFCGLSLGEKVDDNYNYNITINHLNKLDYKINYLSKNELTFDNKFIDDIDNLDDLYEYCFNGKDCISGKNTITNNILILSKMLPLDDNNETDISIKQKIFNFIDTINKLKLIKIDNLDKNDVSDLISYKEIQKIDSNRYILNKDIKNADIKIDNINLKSKMYTTDRYIEFIRYIISRYMTDTLYFTYDDIINEESKSQKYFYKIINANKHTLKKYYTKLIYGTLKTIFKDYKSFSEYEHNENNIAFEKYDINCNDDIIRHLFNEYLIAKHTLHNIDCNTSSNINKSEVKTTNNYKNNIKNLDLFKQKAISNLKNNQESLGIIQASYNEQIQDNHYNKYKLYLIPLKYIIKYIRINDIDTDNILNVLTFSELSDTIDENKNIKIYEDSTIKKIKMYKDNYIKNNHYKSLYKETLNPTTKIKDVNEAYNVTFKLKDINDKINLFDLYKKNYNLLVDKLDISNIIDKIALISVEDIKNIINKYNGTYFDLYDKSILLNNNYNNSNIKVDLNLLNILLYQKCYNMFSYVIPIKRKIDIYKNKPENFKIDIIFFNDISNIEYITNIFVKNLDDTKIYKSKYKFCKSIDKINSKNNKGQKVVYKIPKNKNQDTPNNYKEDNITYNEYLKMKYKEGVIFDKDKTFYEKDFSDFTKSAKDNRFYKLFKINQIPSNLLILDIIENNNEDKSKPLELIIGGKLLKNLHTIKAICYTLFNIKLNIYEHNGLWIDFKNFNSYDLSFDVYENDIKLGKIFLYSSINVDKGSVLTKNIEHQILELINKNQ